MDNLAQLREREAELIQQIKAIDEVLKSEPWQNFKVLVLDKETGRLERILLSEAKSNKINTDKLYQLQGELLGLKRYDLENHANKLIEELKGVKLKLK